MSIHERIDLTPSDTPNLDRSYIQRLDIARHLLSTMRKERPVPAESVTIALADLSPVEVGDLYVDIKGDIAKPRHENRPGMFYATTVVPLEDGNELELTYGGLCSGHDLSPTRVTLIAGINCLRDDSGEVISRTVEHLSALQGAVDPASLLSRSSPATLTE